MSDTILELDHIEKRFGDTGVLHGVSLSVQHGEFVTLLGPSGCGKTTTLRIIAGLETPDAGRVVLRGKGCDGRAAGKARREHRVSELCAVSAYVGGCQHRLQPAAEKNAAR